MTTIPQMTRTGSTPDSMDARGPAYPWPHLISLIFFTLVGLFSKFPSFMFCMVFGPGISAFVHLDWRLRQIKHQLDSGRS